MQQLFLNKQHEKIEFTMKKRLASEAS